MKNILTLTLLFCFFQEAICQEGIVKPDYLNFEMAQSIEERITTSLDLLIEQLKQGELNKNYISDKRTELTLSTL